MELVMQKQLCLCLSIVIFLLCCIGFGNEGMWWTGLFCFFFDLFVLLACVFGLTGQQAMLYMGAALAEVVLILISFGLAIWFLVLALKYHGVFWGSSIVFFIDIVVRGIMGFLCFQIYKAGG